MKEIPAIAIELTESVKKTDQFLNTLRQVGSFYYRRKIHLSDVELEKLVNQNIIAQLQVARDYFISFEFLERRGLNEEFKKFHAEVMAAAQALVGITDEPADDTTEAQG